MIWAVAGGYAVLFIYSLWTMFQNSKLKNERTFLSSQLEVKTNLVSVMSKELTAIKEMYEKRLRANRESLETLKAHLLAHAGPIDRHIIDELSKEEPTEP